MQHYSAQGSNGGRAIAAGISMLLLATAVAGATEQGGPARIEDILGSDVKRVILTAKAAERTDIQTVPLREQVVPRRIVLGGEVEEVPVDQFRQTPFSYEGTAQNSPERRLRVRVLLDKDLDDDGEDDFGEYDDEEDEAEILTSSLADSDEDDDGDVNHEPLRARRVVVASAEGKASDALYFQVKSGANELRPGQRVGVRFTSHGSELPKKVVPYSAIIYDVHGDAWVYTKPEPLVFVRNPVDIEYIVGDMAVLRVGPEVGTQIVSVGAAELLGAETGVGH